MTDTPAPVQPAPTEPAPTEPAPASDGPAPAPTPAGVSGGRTGGWGRRVWRAALWCALAPIVAWALMRGLGLDHRTPWAQLVSYTPYVAVAPLLVAVAAAATRRWPETVVGAVLLGLFVGFVAPRAVPADTDLPADGTGLRVASFNALTGYASVDAVIALLRRERPDVLTVQELTPEWAERLDAAGVASLLPHRALRPLPGAAGTGVYARFPLTDARGMHPDTTFDQTFAVLRPPGRPAVEVVSAHPAPPIPDGLFRPVGRWVRDFGLLPAAPGSGPVRVLAGDFNASLDHALFRGLVDTGYTDAAAAVGRGWEPTWPEDGDPLPPVTIDHVLVDDRAGVRGFRTHVVTGSDHRMVVADLVLPT